MSVTHDTIADVEPLDNPIWHALTGPHAAFSQGTGLAVRYDPEVAVFAGLPDHAGPDAWDTLRTLVGPGGTALLARTDLEVPGGWTSLLALLGHQYVAPADFGATATPHDFVVLGADDVPEMLALVERTQPGPFAKRTVELGPYYGLRDAAGTLVAMTGVRMRPPGYAELSAVCTDAAYRGRGLASALMRTVAADPRVRADRGFLHVRDDNRTALALYERLGFVRRASFEFTVVRAPN